MPLSPEKIAELMALPKNMGRRQSNKNKVVGIKDKKVDHSVRTYPVWFALKHTLVNFDNEMPRCDNPNCIDPRPSKDTHGQTVAMINGKNMCRFCFLDGWMLAPPAEQGELTDAK